MRPTRQIADLCRGVLARAVRVHSVEVHAFVFLSNHFHLLLTVPDAARLSAFMNFLNSNLAREIGRTVDWREKFWGRRYQAIVVSAEPAAQIERLVYLLRHGCKENLVRSPPDWPGASAVPCMLSGERVKGTWIDRTSLYRAARRKSGGSSGTHESVESFELAPLPCWRDLAPEVRRSHVLEIVRTIESETGRRILATGREPLGRKRLERQNPHQAFIRPPRRATPLVHAASRAMRDAFRAEYRRFVDAFARASAHYRRASASGLAWLREGFPAGSFPPPGPFLPTSSIAS